MLFPERQTMQTNDRPSFMSMLLVGLFLAGTIIFLIFSPVPKVKAYNCSLAEISPDYPIDVKMECRKVRAENFNKDLQKPK